MKTINCKKCEIILMDKNSRDCFDGNGKFLLTVYKEKHNARSKNDNTLCEQCYEENN